MVVAGDNAAAVAVSRFVAVVVIGFCYDIAREGSEWIATARECKGRRARGEKGGVERWEFAYG